MRSRLADRVSFGMFRVTHDQNLVLADVPQRALLEVWQRLQPLELATPNIGTLTDMISCPGLDFCGLANAGIIRWRSRSRRASTTSIISTTSARSRSRCLAA